MNKEKIIEAIKSVSMSTDTSPHIIYQAIEPYLLRYDRQKMYEAVDDFTEIGEMTPMLNAIESALGLHTPAPVGGEQNPHPDLCKLAGCDGVHHSEKPQEKEQPQAHWSQGPIVDRTPLGQSQEKQCTCSKIDATLHAYFCPLYQQPSLEEAPKLPKEVRASSNAVEAMNQLVRFLAFYEPVLEELMSKRNKTL